MSDTQKTKRVRTPKEQFIFNEAKRKVKILRWVEKLFASEKQEFLSAIQESLAPNPEQSEFV